MANDPLSDVRSVRRAISSECGDRPDEVFDYYQNMQERMKQSGRYKFVNTRMEKDHTASVTEQGDASEP